MQAVIYYSSAPKLDYGLSGVVKIAQKIMGELDVQLDVVNLYEKEIPFYAGQPHSITESLFRMAANADFVIFATPVSWHAPSSMVKNFLDYLQYPTYQQLFDQKKCFIITVARGQGEAECANYISKVIGMVKGIDAGRMAIGGNAQMEVENGSYDLVEKYLEDFYRTARQTRGFFMPSGSSDSSFSSVLTRNLQDGAKNAAPDPFQNEIIYEPVQEKPLLDLDKFSEKQAEDIEALTQLFSQKLSEEAEKTIAPKESFTYQKPMGTPPVRVREKTCKQMTQSLVHYYQPQLAGNLQAVFQIHISGAESFDAYIEVLGSACEYHDGTASQADIIILAQSDVWGEVLKGQYSAQKAFMTGRLKVRGNFVLLNKFDQIFKIPG